MVSGRHILIFLSFVCFWREQECYSRLLQPKAAAPVTRRRGKKEAEQKTDSEPEAVEVLVDILLSLLVNPSALTREVAVKVFRKTL